jgi:hypothetical protein
LLFSCRTYRLPKMETDIRKWPSGQPLEGNVGNLDDQRVPCTGIFFLKKGVIIYCGTSKEMKRKKNGRILTLPHDIRHKAPLRISRPTASDQVLIGTYIENTSGYI